MRWTDLALLHWPVPAALVRPLVPVELTLDTYDGEAWVGILPFRMEDTRVRLAPRIPTATNFPELNVRTYVRAGGGRASGSSAWTRRVGSRYSGRWSLLRDLSDPLLWIERYHSSTWTEYLRHNQRFTQDDSAVGEHTNSLHLGPGKTAYTTHDRASDRLVTGRDRIRVERISGSND